MTQKEALTILKTGANVFLTGEPGSGKTHTVNAYVEWLRHCGIEPAITASTGIAATHIGGLTIHSWSGIGVRHKLTEYDLDHISQNKNVTRRINNARILIIDEVSMLSANTLSMIDAVCRETRRNHEVFGGLQVILVGDFFQLPPISRRDDETAQQTMMDMDDREKFAYQSFVWTKLNPLVCYLSEQHRQEDNVFLEFLGAMRRAAITDSHRQLLSTRYVKEPPHDVTHLYSHNADVDTINNHKLHTLAGKTKVFEMGGKGPEKLVASLKRGCLSPEKLSLKVGARVMFTKNDGIKQRYVNGTLGIVTGFGKDDGWPIVKTITGAIVLVEPNEWRIEDDGKILARIIQVPLRLAWALTVHKSQGISLDAAHMDLANTFEYGQGYVALSRVRTIKGLTLSGVNQRALEVHPNILSKDREFRIASDEVEKTFAEMPQEEIALMHKNFIRACGGKMATQNSHAEELKNKPIGNRKTARWEHTLALILSGMSLEEVAERRGRKKETIIEHLEKLAALGKLEVGAVAHLAKGRERDIAKVQDAFKNLESMFLKPVFEKLGGQVPYETIRIARLLLKCS